MGWDLLRRHTMYQVDGWNNFCRVFEMPKDEDYSNEFCHNGGHPNNFQMIDWFYPVEGVFMAGCSKEVYRKEVGEIPVTEVDHFELKDKLIPFLEQKVYLKNNRKYIAICDFGASYVFEKKA